MRALLCTRFGKVEDVIELADIPEPTITSPDDVIIKVSHASVSHAIGLMIEGKYQRKPPFPFVPGTEAVGRVLACGSSVEHVRPGDHVVTIADWGCYAEQLKTSRFTVYPLPDGLPMLNALPVPLSYGTAYTGLLWRCGLKAGERVLVFGSGAGVGLAAVEIAAQLGAEVIACASTEEKRQEALARGAAHAVSPSDNLAREVKELTGQRGVDIVVDPVGGPLFIQGVRAAAPHARILSIGFASGTVPDVPLNLVLVKNLTIHGFFFGVYTGWTPVDQREHYAAATQEAMQQLLTWARDGTIRPDISKTYPINGLKSALNDLQHRRVVGKIALSI